jgi:hypothetical protein
VITLDELSTDIKDRIGSLGTADFVIALPAIAAEAALRDAVGRVRRAIHDVAPGSKTVLVHPQGVVADNPGFSEGEGLALLPFPISPLYRFPAPGQNVTDVYRAVFALSNRFGGRGCAIVGSDCSALVPEALGHLVRPILCEGLDFVAPYYQRRRFDALLVSAAITPVVRALYGKRINFPVGADFAFSTRLIERYLQTVGAERSGLAVWLSSEAICGGFEVGQARLGVPIPPHRDSADVSAAVAEVMGPLFVDIERNAAFWQKVRGSQAVPTFGSAPAAAEEPGTVEVGRMVESFRLGYRNLQEVWNAVLPPATLLELKRLTQLPPDNFRLPDELWVRFVYDFALAHRLRLMSRDHLAGAMTPVYLAWVASYALEVGTATPFVVEQRLERLGAAYEAQKPYLVSRWRWPDRFNP